MFVWFLLCFDLENLLLIFIPAFTNTVYENGPKWNIAFICFENCTSQLIWPPAPAPAPTPRPPASAPSPSTM